MLSRLSVPALLMLMLLAGCGSDSAPRVQENFDPNRPPDGPNYTGPPPQTLDVQLFKVSVWDNLASDNRCASCHGTGGQEPAFVRADDINLAYAIANNYVDLEQPANSRLATRVGEGHNCWQGSDAACADIITGYIESWAAALGHVTTRIEFEAPNDRQVGSSKIFPAQPGAFVSTVYPLLTQYCSECHTPVAPTSQQPYLASSNLQMAYDAAKTRMRLDNPAASRLVQRLRDEGHNCWSNDCAASAAAMQAAIADLAASIPETQVDPNLVVSRALSLGDGMIASTGGRMDAHIIARYEFKTGSGAVAYDTSGVDPAANLNLSGDVEWMSSWGLRLNTGGGPANGKAQASTSGSRKLHQLITATGEYSIEAWVIPDNVTQGDGGGDTTRIVSYSGSDQVRNFTLGQTMYNYEFLNRSSASNANGLPALFTDPDAERLQSSLQYVVVTFDPVQGRRIYVNGEYTGDGDTFAGASLDEWDETFALVVGNEVSGTNNAWSGSIRFLAIHNRALSPEAIAGNYEVGVGARYFLLFNVSQLINVPGSYIAFEVQQFDDYSYLFAEPFFVTLEAGAQVPAIPVRGIRVGINGSEAGIGQVFAALDTEIGGPALVDGRQRLSSQGAVIEVQQGPDSDEFFLTFDRLGDHEFVRVEGEFPAPPPAEDIADQSRIGVRSFAAVNASLAKLTGVPSTRPSVAATYQQVRQQMPTRPEVDGFVAAQQMGVTQLAVSYCNALVNDSGLRASYFGGFGFDAQPSAAFNSAGRSALIDPLLRQLLVADVGGGPLASQAHPDAVRAELNGLIDNMIAGCGNCGSQRTRQTATAVCAAAMGSALMLLQ